MDYSSNNEYLASVYENGIIDIFGLKTKIKCHTIILDKNSAVAKFNPAKRFFLNVASISGAVTVYDINTKKIYFQQKDAHSAPCRDLIVPFEIPERLLSAGYDSTIKIFDTRIKRAGMDIKASCGFSTIDTTPCGRFFVVGNLKGEIISYDMRNINSHFATFQAEKSTINKVLIVNNSTKDCSMMPKESSSPKLSTEPLPTTAAPDFFNEVMSHQRRVSDFSSNFQSRISMISNRESTCSRISDNFGLQNVGNMLNDLSDGDMPSFSEKIPEQTSFKTHKDNHINSERLKRSDLPSSTEKNPEQTSFKTHEDNHINSERLKKRTTHILDVVEKPRSTKRISLLENINEETTVLTESDKENNSLTSNSTGIDKKQELAQKLLNINQVGILKSEARKNANELIQRRSINSPKIEITNATSIDNSETDGTGIQAQLSAEMKDEFGIMRTEMNGKISELYQLINFDMAGNTLDLKTYIFNVKRELQEKMKMVEECVGMLMLDNPVINQVLELQEENRNLRKQLSDVMRR